MTGRERKRRLARERYERNLARRARTRQRKRYMVIGAVLAVVIIGGASALAATLGLPNGARGSSSTAGTSGASPSAPAQAQGQPSCSYERLPEGQRGDPNTFVGLAADARHAGEGLPGHTGKRTTTRSLSIC